MRNALALFAVALFAGCASAPAVDRGEPRTVIGRSGDVRLNAHIANDFVSSGSVVQMTYEIENLRARPIAIAELVPEVSYDAGAQTITVAVGTEVPGHEILPRLAAIKPGEKRVFTTGVRMPVVRASPLGGNAPRTLQIKAHVLREVEPFTKLIGISERSIHDPVLADDLFVPWLEHNETIVTNAIPITWGSAMVTPATHEEPRHTPRRRGRP